VFVGPAGGSCGTRVLRRFYSKKGTLLAFAEGRAANADQAKNKLVLKRSEDGGQTWSKIEIIASEGDNALNNPCAVVEQETGRVLLMYQSYPANLSEQSGTIETGHEGHKIVRNYLITSDDDGKTWSKPRDLTKTTKRPEKVNTIASGPGIGIQLRHGKHAGRLLIPFNEGPWGAWNIYTVYSDDRGETWHIGDVAPDNFATDAQGNKTSMVNEAQIVELKDGSVRFNVRRWAGKPVRKTSVSTDGGVTWSSVKDVPEQDDPSCMASVLRYTDPADGERSRILYSGPQSTRRDNGTVHLSYDEGETWPIKRLLVKEGFAYSCLVALPDGTIGCLYEADGMRRIAFARFTLDWLTEGRDKLQQVQP
jgi:sialidase-1